MYPKLVAGPAGVCLRVTALLLLVLLFGGCTLYGETPGPVATPTAPTAAILSSPTRNAVATATQLPGGPAADGSGTEATSSPADPPANTPIPEAAATGTGVVQKEPTSTRTRAATRIPQPTWTGAPARAQQPTSTKTPSRTPTSTPTRVPTHTALPSHTPLTGAAQVGGCPMFPADNIWNRKIAALPTQTLSNTYMRSIGLDAPLHPGFGAQWRGEPLGIPFTTVPGDQPLVPLSFLYGAESDPGPYPIPQSAPVEVNIDHHVLVVERGSCTLYELYKANRENDGSWYARSGAYWRLDSNDLRPDGWTSADAAGLPILPGLVRYDEVMSGAVRHALRFTVPVTSKSYVWPARHSGGESDDPNQPPMGIRLRLKANVDISRYPAPLRVLFQTLKDYGMFLADNGDPPLNVAGAPDERWDNNMLVAGMESLRGSDFEVVDESSLMIDPDSGQSR